MKSKEQTRFLTGGMILITLGVLIILSKTDTWKFGQSWPLLLIVIAFGTLIRRIKDIGGWIIGSIGFFFLLSENFGVKVYAVTAFILPALLIAVGVHLLVKYIRK